MIGYNLYYNGKKLNSRELSEKDVEYIRQRAHVYKIDKETNQKIIVPTNKIQCVKCIII